MRTSRLVHSVAAAAILGMALAWPAALSGETAPSPTSPYRLASTLQEPSADAGETPAATEAPVSTPPPTPSGEPPATPTPSAGAQPEPTPAAGTEEPDRRGLPVTGAQVGGMVVLGGGLIAAGIAMQAVRRRVPSELSKLVDGAGR